jgi:hypothetical protein
MDNAPGFAAPTTEVERVRPDPLKKKGGLVLNESNRFTAEAVKNLPAGGFQQVAGVPVTPTRIIGGKYQGVLWRETEIRKDNFLQAHLLCVKREEVHEVQNARLVLW